MTSALEQVETAARSIRRGLRERERPTATSLLELRIAFFFEHLEGVREVHRELLRHILRAECYVGTDLLALDGYAPKTWHFRLGARDNLKNKLLHLDMERRKLITHHEREVRDVQTQLLELLAEHALLRM